MTLANETSVPGVSPPAVFGRELRDLLSGPDRMIAKQKRIDAARRQSPVDPDEKHIGGEAQHAEKEQDFATLLLQQAQASGIELKPENVEVKDGLSP